MRAILTIRHFTGWAYDLKTVSEELIRKRALRTGDGSNDYSECIRPKTPFLKMDENNNEAMDANAKDNQSAKEEETMIWGWDDADMHAQDKHDALILNKVKTI